MTEDDILIIIDELMFEYRALKDQPSNVYKLNRLAFSEFEMQVIENRTINSTTHERFGIIVLFSYNVSSISILFELIENIKHELL